jgi:cytochrome c peroxidase
MSLDAKTWIFCVCIGAAQVTTSRAVEVCPSHLQFLKSRCAQWQLYVLPQNIPAANGNAFANDLGAAALGMKIFFDNRFSKSGSGVACVSCHDPEHAFAERKPKSNTLREVARNAPDLINASWYGTSHFWDGKVDNLWSAPLFTFEQEDEMGSSRLSVVHTLASIYKTRYEKIFGSLPDISDTQRFPAYGKPGMPQFDAMSTQDKNLVNQTYANVGKALEAYIRKLAAGRSPFDDFMNGSAKSISADAKHGMVAFTRHGCDGCHFGPTFTDEGFHNLRNPGKPGQARDLARGGGLAFATTWQFSSSSQFADSVKAGLKAKVTQVSNDPEGFRTPSLRNVDSTAPYGHDGAFATLDQAIDAHARVLPQRGELGARDKHDIIEFLRALTGRPPQAPWNYWPGG